MFMERSCSRLGLVAAMLLPALAAAHARDICADPPVSGGKIEDRIVKRSVWLGGRQFEMALLKPQPLNDKGEPDIKGIGIHNTGVPFVLREDAKKWNGCTKLAGHHEGHFNPKGGVKLGGIAYHFYIDNNGAVFEGRDIKYVGATYTQYDPTGLVTVVLEGAFAKSSYPVAKDKIADFKSRGLIDPKSVEVKRSKDRNGNPVETTWATYAANTPTTAQIASLKELLVWLSERYGVDPMSTEVGHGIHGHDEFPDIRFKDKKKKVVTSCPGKNLSDRLTELRQSTKDGLAALRPR